MCPDVYYVTSDQKSIDFNCTSQVFENQWSSWTTCSSSCGLLVTNRTREYCNFSAACIGNASCGDSMFLFDMMEHPLGDSLAILNVLYNEFAIGFDLFFNDTSISTSVFLFADGWGSIMTLIDLNNDNLKITVGGNTFDSKVILNTWNSITVLQQYINSSYYNAINVNGFESPSVQNLNPNVGLLACPYTGSSFENDHYKIMNLYIVSKMQDVSKCNSLKAPCSWSNAVSLYINGSYVCSCSEGWILDQDNSSCIAVESTIAALTTTSSAPTATTYISTTTTDTPTTTTASLITTNAVPTTTTGALAATISAPTSTTAAPTTASADPATTSSASTITAAQAMTTAAHTNTIKTFTATPALTTITAALTIATAALTINATPTAIAVAQITTSITTVSSLTTLTTAKPITATTSLIIDKELWNISNLITVNRNVVTLSLQIYPNFQIPSIVIVEFEYLLSPLCSFISNSVIQRFVRADANQLKYTFNGNFSPSDSFNYNFTAVFNDSTCPMSGVIILEIPLILSLQVGIEKRRTFTKTTQKTVECFNIPKRAVVKHEQVLDESYGRGIYWDNNNSHIYVCMNQHVPSKLNACYYSNNNGELWDYIDIRIGSIIGHHLITKELYGIHRNQKVYMLFHKVKKKWLAMTNQQFREASNFDNRMRKNLESDNDQIENLGPNQWLGGINLLIFAYCGYIYSYCSYK